MIRDDNRRFFRMNRMIRIIIAVSTVFIFVAATHAATDVDEATRQVLVINSYHTGYLFSDEEYRGFTNTIASYRLPLDVHVEYMDAKRFNNPEVNRIFAELIKQKYFRMKYDIVIAMDNDAYNFVLAHRNDIFLGRPIVFCGVNNFEPARIRSVAGITGIIESPDYSGTLDCALRLFPDTRRVYVISDGTTTGRAHESEVRKIEPQFGGRARFIYLSLADMSFSECEKRLRMLRPGDIVFLLSHFMDRDKRIISQTTSMSIVTNACRVPIFVVNDTRVVPGVVGGRVISGFAQGQTAGMIAIRVLDGVSPESIPVTALSANRYMFDDSTLRRFNLNKNDLPEGSIVINVPESFMHKYRYQVIPVLLVFIILVTIIIALVANMMNRRRAQKALDDINQRYELIAENMSDTIWLIDSNFSPIFLSPSMARICGHPMDTLYAMTMSEYLTPESFRVFKNCIFHHMRSNGVSTGPEAGPEKIELEFPRKDGSILIAETQIKVLKNGKEGILGILGVGRDITERRTVETALRESERRIRNMLENVQLITIMRDFEGTLLFCNEYFLRVTGWKKEEVIMRNWADFFVPPDFRENGKHALPDTSLDFSTNESEVQTRDGRKLTICWNNTVLKSISGDVIGSTSIGIDVTEQRRSETELRASEERFRTFIEQAAEGIALVDETGVVIEWNRAYESLTGIGREEAVGKFLWDIQYRYASRDRKNIKWYARNKAELLQSLLAGRSKFMNRQEDVVFERSDGEVKYVSQTMFPIQTGNKYRLGLVTIDITERKIAEDKIKASLEEKEILLKEIHHRVKNNLQIITSLLHLQERYVKDPNALGIFRDSRNRIKSMAMVHEKLYQSKDLSRIDFDGYVRSLGTGLLDAYGISSNKVTLAVSIGENHISVDTHIVCGLLINELMSNALKYAFPDDRKGEIIVMLREDNGICRLTVSDNGVGIPEGFSIENAESLGLRLINAMVQQLNGKLYVHLPDEARGGGTEFIVEFPV
jgi:PAS domain S-box-containing protein